MMQMKCESSMIAMKIAWERDRKKINSKLMDIFELPKIPILRYEDRYILFIDKNKYQAFGSKINEFIPKAEVLDNNHINRTWR